MEQKRENLGLLAVLCAVFLAFVGSSLLGVGGGNRARDAFAHQHSVPHGPSLEATIRVTNIDTDQGIAGVNITLRGGPNNGAWQTLAMFPGGSRSDTAAAAAAAAASTSSLELTVGSLSMSLPWPLPASGGHAPAIAATVPLLELVGKRLMPFDAYSLPLAPLSAVLHLCGSDSSRHGSGEDSPDEHGVVGQPDEDSSPGSSEHCARVMLPVRLVLDIWAVPGFQLSPRTGLHSSSSKAGPEGFAAGDALVITRATSQRVLRLMSQFLRYAVGGAVAVRCVGELLSRWLMRRFFGRVQYGM